MRTRARTREGNDADEHDDHYASLPPTQFITPAAAALAGGMAVPGDDGNDLSEVVAGAGSALAAISRTIPLAQLMDGQIAAMRHWSRGRARQAGAGRGEIGLEGRAAHAGRR